MSDTPITEILSACNKCGGEKRKTPKGFYYCPPCKWKAVKDKGDEAKISRAASAKARYHKNVEDRRAKRANYREANREKIDSYQKEYREAHKEERKVRDKVYIEANREKITERRSVYYANNRDVILERNKEYYQEHQDRLLEYAKNFRDNRMHPLYKSWDSIVQRCYNPNSNIYLYYGGRGIKMCDRWRESFDAFAEDMGHKPEDGFRYSIERKRVNGNYEPGNCKWATDKEQAANKTNSRRNQYGEYADVFIDHEGEKISLRRFGDLSGIVPIVLIERYKTHFYPDLILDCPQDNRFYEYNDIMYSVEEASLIVGRPFQEVARALRKEGKTIEDLVSR